MTMTEQLAVSFGLGQTSVEDVLTSVRAAKPKTYAYSGGDYDLMMTRYINDDDAPEVDRNGWDGVVAVFRDGGLTAEQFDALYEAYTGG